jgi:ubiquinol-cytochrome c reductase cytochrome c1 subunit
MKKYNIVIVALFLIFNHVMAVASGSVHLERANNILSDKTSLQKGAILFATRCMSCHSVKYMRYNRVARDLGWTDEEVLKKLGKVNNKVVDNIIGSMSETVAQAAFGTKIPDLSLISRLKGTDYIFSFLRSFELNTTTGKWDNRVFLGVAMPNIMPKPKDEASLEKYDEDVRNIVNFLEYVGEPAKLKRQHLGWKVMLFLFILFILVYLLKREYWKDIKH